MGKTPSRRRRRRSKTKKQKEVSTMMTKSMKMLLGAVMLLCVTTRATVTGMEFEHFIGVMNTVPTIWELYSGSEEEEHKIYEILTAEKTDNSTKYDELKEKFGMKLGHINRLIQAVKEYYKRQGAGSRTQRTTNRRRLLPLTGHIRRQF